MNVEELREFCLSLPEAEENMPWTEPQYNMLATFTIAGKWFCLINMEQKFINVKAAPETIAEMQDRYQGAFPAWHMNKQHWLGIRLESDIPDERIRELLSDAYKLVVDKLPAAIRHNFGPSRKP